MTDLDSLPFDMGHPPEPSAPNGAKGRKCRHAKDHRSRVLLSPDGVVWDIGYQGQPQTAGYAVTWRCECGHVADPAVVRRNRNNRKRGNAKQRKVMVESGFANVGGAGGAEDGLDAVFAVQHKAYQSGRYPGWALQELDHLRVGGEGLRPISEGRVPLLIVSESPGAGRKAREPVAILTLRELLALVRD
jgi:hypothetical protein